MPVEESILLYVREKVHYTAFFFCFFRYLGDGEILKTLFKRHGQPLETPPYLRGKINLK